MTDPVDQPEDRPEPLRVLVVDDGSFPREALRRLAAMGIEVAVIEPQVVLCPGSSSLAIDQEMLSRLMPVMEPALPPVEPFPRNRQGKDYDNVFRRPRGRPRR